jgi:hypothetical protein
MVLYPHILGRVQRFTLVENSAWKKPNTQTSVVLAATLTSITVATQTVGLG